MRIPLWDQVRGAIDARAERHRARFDRATLRPVLLVSRLALFAAVPYVIGAILASRLCGAHQLSPLELGLTFSAKTFAAMLAPLPPACRIGVAGGLLTDVVFAFLYALFLRALYLWVERFRRHRPGEPPPAEHRQGNAEPGLSPAPLTWLSSMTVLLPFVAAWLDVLAENLPHLLAVGWLWIHQNVPDDTASGLVIAGSIGAALKWSALGVYLLGLLMMFFRGPRGRVLWHLRFSVVAVVVGALAILVVPQGQDILQRLVEGTSPGLRVVFSVGALFGAALVVWYSGRVLTMVRLTRDAPRQDEAWMCYFERHIPRLLGVAVLALAGLAFARAASVAWTFVGVTVLPYLALILISNRRSRPLAAWGTRPPFPRRLRDNLELRDRIARTAIAVLLGMIILWGPAHEADDRRALRLAAWLSLTAAWLLYLLVYFRRDLLGAARGTKPAWADPCVGHRPDVLPSSARTAAVLAGIGSLVLLVLFTFLTVDVARLFGPLVVLALAVANAVYMGSVLAYLGRKARLPLVTMLLGLAVIFSLWNDNHAIRIPSPAPPPDTLHRVGVLRERFAAWVMARAQEDSGSIPVVLVAAAGGGLRAAYWSSVSLATLQDRDSAFARHVFAISGVSGGSLGAAVFTAMVRDLARPANAPECLTSPDTGTAVASVSSAVRSRAPAGPVTTCVRQFMGDDFLSPVLAKTVAPDFLQWFLPFPIRAFDRARALEQSWERSYKRWAGANTFDTLYLSLYADPAEALKTPLLLLNTTHVQAGRRYVTAPFVDDGAFLDARSVQRALGADLRLSTAVHNSARFTYVSPAGRIERHDGVSYGSLVDGGYFENSGLVTASDVRREIDSVRAAPPTQTLAPMVQRTKVIVLYLCNDPLACRRDRVADSSLAAERGLAGEWLSPLLALLHTRDARGSYARAALARMQGPNFFQLNVCDSLVRASDQAAASIARERVVHPPLGWQLSRLARDWMDASLVAGAAAAPSGGSDSSHTTGASCQRNNAATLDAITAMLTEGRRPVQR